MKDQKVGMKAVCCAQVYCEMGLDGGGYTFFDPQHLPTLTNDDVQAMITDRSHVLCRVQCKDSRQPFIVISPDE